MENPKEAKRAEPVSEEKFGIVLPCAQEDFSEFISGILGKAQTIDKHVHGPFEITVHDIKNVFALVDQRIRQQNEASLVQFTVRVIYSDNSSVLLNSLDDFMHYTEVRPLISVAAHLSWIYLVRFQDKSYPEKQQIEMSFVAGSGDDEGLIIHVGPRLHPISPFQVFGNYISFRINHTARTWGIDIEALLTGHINSLLKEENKIKRFIYRHSDGIGMWSAVLLFAGAVAGAFHATSEFFEHQLDTAQPIMQSKAEALPSLNEKINFLLELTVQGGWPRLEANVGVFLLASLIVAIVLGIWISTNAENRPPSFVLLSKRAMEKRQEVIEKRKRKWLLFGFSLAVNLVTGVLSNIVFALYFSGRFK